MLTNEFINNAIGVSEAFMAPARLMQILMIKQDREKLFDIFLEQEKDLSYDWFLNYFQQEHGDRDKLKQDYTPSCLAQILSGISPQGRRIGDLCCGSGSLIIKMWYDNLGASFYGEEISERVLPFLLFNLSIRNMDALIKLGDSLKREYKKTYKLTPGDRFSEIEESSALDYAGSLDCLVSNPPYSLTWDPKYDERFMDYGLAPKSKADWAFVLHGLHLLKPGGTASFILPHGVLFRGQSEGAIRKALLESGQLKTVIGVPDKLFLATAIPVAILQFEKCRTSTDVLFIAAEKEYQKGKAQNTLTCELINKIVHTANTTKELDSYSRVVSLGEIAENDYNLNIPRYVQNWEEEKLPDLTRVLKNLADLEKEIRKNEAELFAMISQLQGITVTQAGAFREWERACLSNSTDSKILHESKEQKKEKPTQQVLF